MSWIRSKNLEYICHAKKKSSVPHYEYANVDTKVKMIVIIFLYLYIQKNVFCLNRQLHKYPLI